MQFFQFTIPDHLKDSIESVIYFKDFQPAHSIERIVPTGHVFLIFEFDDIIRNTFKNETLAKANQFSKAWISGVHEHYISISAHLNSEMMAIQFKPGFSFPFIHVPTDEFRNSVVSAESLVGPEILELRDKMKHVLDENEKFSILCTWLTNRIESRLMPPIALYNLLDQMKFQHNKLLVDFINSYPLSHKQLITHFKKYVGVNPKLFHRILRFNQILNHLTKNEKVSWADITYQLNYTDQSHFIKEFFHFSGFNPSEFILKDFDSESSNFFPIG